MNTKVTKIQAIWRGKKERIYMNKNFKDKNPEGDLGPALNE